MKTTIALFVFVVAAMLMQGCATIFNSGTQTVAFSSTPDAVDIELVDKEGNVFSRGATPCTISLKRGSGYFSANNFTVRSSKAGFASTETKVEAKVHGWYFGNLLFGGLVGMLAVDPLTGGMYAFDDKIHIDLTPSPSVAPAAFRGGPGALQDADEPRAAAGKSRADSGQAGWALRLATQ